jgi:drug/metabolite transporter (DMT)-like permease
MKRRYILMALLVAFSWGINAPIVKLTLSHIPLFFFCTLRSAILGGLLLIYPRTVYPFKTIGVFSLAHGLKITLLYMSVTVGLTAGLSTVVLQTQSLFAVLFSFLFFKEKISLHQYIGLLISFIGVLLIGNETLNIQSFFGFCLALTAAVSSSLSIIILKGQQRLTYKEALSFVGWFNILSVIPFAALSLFFEGSAPWLNFATLLTPYVLLLIILGAFTVIGAYVFLSILMAKNKTATVSSYLLLTPVFGIGSAYLCINEYCTIISLIGTSIVVIGLAINQGLSLRKLRV